MLRDSLGFHGLIVTDALNMAGVADLYGAEAGVRAFLAGADLLLQPADPRATIDAMEARRRAGEISPERLDRVGAAGAAAQALYRSVQAAHGAARQRPGRRRQRRVQGRGRDIASRSVVMVKDVGGTIHGLKSARPGAHAGDLCRGRAPHRRHDAGGGAAGRRDSPVTLARLWPSSGPASYDSAAVAIGAESRSPSSWPPESRRGLRHVGLNPALGTLIDDHGACAAHDPRLARQSLSHLAGARGGLVSRSAGAPIRSPSRRSRARWPARRRSRAGCPSRIPPRYPRGWGVQRRIDP